MQEQNKELKIIDVDFSDRELLFWYSKEVLNYILKEPEKAFSYIEEISFKSKYFSDKIDDIIYNVLYSMYIQNILFNDEKVFIDISIKYIRRYINDNSTNESESEYESFKRNYFEKYNIINNINTITYESFVYRVDLLKNYGIKEEIKAELRHWDNIFTKIGEETVTESEINSYLLDIADKVSDILVSSLPKVDTLSAAFDKIWDNIFNPVYSVINLEEFPILSNVLGGGIQNNRIYAISGGAGRGKSTFALQIAENIVKKSSPVLYVSLEMSPQEVMLKSISRKIRKNSLKIREKDISKHDKSFLKDLSNYLVLYEADDIMDIKDLDYVIKSVKRKYKDIISGNNQGKDRFLTVIVDPVQRILWDKKEIVRDEYSVVSKVVKGIKKMASKEGIAFIILSDTTKEAVKKVASDELGMRGSYMINHVSDVVMHLNDLGFGEAINDRDNVNQSELNVIQDKKLDIRIEEEKNRDYFAEIAKLGMSKNRSGYKRDIYYVYYKGIHTFEEESGY